MTSGPRALWRCPSCGARFTTRNQQHSCGRFDLDALFARSQPSVRRLYTRFLRLARREGPVTVIPQKTRVAFQVRMRFAAVTPLKTSLRGHLILAARQEATCFERVESLSARCHVHFFRLHSEAQVGSELAHWVAEAYKVGRQEHLLATRGAGVGSTRRGPRER